MNFIEQFYYDNKKKFWIFILVLIAFILTVIFSNKAPEKSEYDKRISNLDYVYTNSSTTPDDNEVKSEMPVVNLNGEEIDIINNDIMNRYNEIIAVRDSQVYYKYSVNGKILSILLISLENSEEGDSPYNGYYSYNIDMELKTIIPNSYMLKIKGKTEDDVRESIRTKMNEYYNYEVKKGYLDSSTCDLNCYLINRNLDLEDLSDIVIYLNEDGKFVVYKSYNLSYDYIMDYDVKDNPFEFIID